MSTQAEPQPEPRRAQSRGRATVVWAVLVVAGLLLLLSSFAVWINRVALNTGVFTDTSSSLLDNDQIRRAVANRAVDELFANVDVQAEVQAQLPADYKGLSGPAAAGLRQASYQIVDRALEQPVFQDLFRVALEESHTTLVQILEGGGDRVSTNERRGNARPAGDHPRGRRPHRHRRPDRGQDPGGRGADRRPALGPARHRTERVPAPEDARLVPADPDARSPSASRSGSPEIAAVPYAGSARRSSSSASSASSPRS